MSISIRSQGHASTSTRGGPVGIRRHPSPRTRSARQRIGGTYLNLKQPPSASATMLPKVATHILHTTSRAAAAVHNQTSTLRNVLQLQTSSSPSSAAGSANIGPWNGNGSSSRGNSHGPGPGGPKQNAGSRFYAGFTVSQSSAFFFSGIDAPLYKGPVRAVSQATAVTSQDGTFVQHDEEEPVPARRAALQRASKGHRIRSSSVSVSRVETLGILKTVQIHVRSRHAFAHTQSGKGTAKATATRQHPRRLIARRNSTSSQTSQPIAPIRRNSTYAPDESSVNPASIPLPPSPSATTIDLSSSDPSHPQQPSQHVFEIFDNYSAPAALPQESPAFADLKAARDSRDPNAIADAVRRFRQEVEKPTIEEFNLALEALTTTRRPGEPLTLMMETYNDIVRSTLIPTIETYSLIIRGLAQRDFEVQWLIQGLRARLHRKATMTGDLEFGDPTVEKQKLAALEKEDNFGPALHLFDTVLSMEDGSKLLPIGTYMSLLRICAYRGEATQSARVFSLLERLNVKLAPSAYKFVLQAYANSGDIENAEDTFEDFRTVCTDRPNELHWQGEGVMYDQSKILPVWNQMIDAYFHVGMPDKAVGLVEQMLSKSPDATDVPFPSSMTYTSILNGFCSTGDVQTAFVWFNRLLEQPESPSSDPLLQNREVIRPDKIAWDRMIEALAYHNMVDELNTVFMRLLKDGPKDSIYPASSHRSLTLVANLNRLPSLDAAQAEQTLSFLTDKVMQTIADGTRRQKMVEMVERACINRGLFKLGAQVMFQFIRQRKQDTDTLTESAAYNVWEHVNLFSASLYESTQGNVPFDVVLSLWRFADEMGQTPAFADRHIPFVLRSYGLARRAGTLPEDIKLKEWAALLNSANQLEAAIIGGYRRLFPTIEDDAFPGIVSLVEDMEARGFKLTDLDEQLVNWILKIVFFRYETKDLNAITSRLGLDYNHTLEELQAADRSPQSVHTLIPEEQVTSTSSPTLSPGSDGAFPVGEFSVNDGLTVTVEKLIRNPKKDTSVYAYNRMMEALPTGQIPSPAAIGLLIETLGRNRKTDKLNKVYTAIQDVLRTFGQDKQFSREAWFKIEDSMIIGLAHAGEVEAAHSHRRRVLANKGVPSADAYGVLIYTVKDTTDDTSNALGLYNEAVSLNVTPNLYLYNNIISKLAKARKADEAMHLFHKMTSDGIYPSSITFGAIIGACARVGDVQNAEGLFMEMERARNFRPRVPPYNTMMQMYTTTKPNRERALHYYEKMRRDNVEPTAHTYKVTLTCHLLLYLVLTCKRSSLWMHMVHWNRSTSKEWKTYS